MPSERPAVSRKQFRHFVPLETRWMDNDVYGHVNNVTYYSFFDSAVNRYLIEAGGLDIHHSPIVAFVVRSECDYFSPIAYPDSIEIGLRVNHLGNRSVTYGVAVFCAGAEKASAYGQFVHVFVARASQQAVAIPTQIRAALEKLEVDHEH